MYQILYAEIYSAGSLYESVKKHNAEENHWKFGIE